MPPRADRPPPTPPARAALERARARTCSRASTRAGYWKAELETNVTMDAEDLLLRQFLGIRARGRDARGARPGSARSSSADGGCRDLRTAVRRTSRRRSRPTPRCVWRATRADAAHMRRARRARARRGRHRGVARLHAHLARALRRVVVARSAGAAARGDPAAALVPAQHLRLRLLGAPDDRAADRRGGAPAGARARLSRSTSCAPGRRRRGRAPRCATGRAASSALDRALHLYERRPLPALRRHALGALRRVDPAPPGGGRLLGRHPAALGLLDDGAPSARLPARSSGAGAGTRRARRLRDRRERRAPPRGVSVAGLGHGARDGRARATRACRPTDPALLPRRGLAAAARRSACRATGRCGARSSSRAAGPSSSRTTTTPTSTTPPR